jgi:hypothetical protein
VRRIIEGREGHLGQHAGGKVTGVNWQQGEESGTIEPISWSIAAACGAAIWRRNPA